MSPSATDVVDVYQLHLLLREIIPAIWRRVLVRSDSSLADLHHTIQWTMGWSDDHLISTTCTWCTRFTDSLPTEMYPFHRQSGRPPCTRFTDGKLAD